MLMVLFWRRTVDHGKREITGKTNCEWRAVEACKAVKIALEFLPP